jgi:hypothetical protein
MNLIKDDGEALKEMNNLEQKEENQKLVQSEGSQEGADGPAGGSGVLSGVVEPVINKESE